MDELQRDRTITIYDIAEEAGVSPATVSRVLTGNAHVRREKRERVQELIAKYNFVPNALAKGLSNTTTKSLGIVAADIRNPFYAAVFMACEQAAERLGYTVGLFNSLGKIENEEEQIERFRQQKADAIILLGGRVDDLVTHTAFAEHVREICRSTPVVVTGKLDRTPCYNVRIDASNAMRQLMEHLFELGHERIALVGGRLDVTSTYEKYQTYSSMLHARGIRESGDYVVNGGYDYQSGYEGMNRLLKLKARPTAVVAINDFAATGILRSVVEHGLSIPGDISVVSFDNTYLSELSIPKLTTTDYDYDYFGRMIAETAIAAAEGRDPAPETRIETTLIVRESSGPAPGTGGHPSGTARKQKRGAITGA
ncbi:MAG: LacI family DNA-binding transcriptional regulator [Lachnospiraceae bacterium]|nr:LacI family DNA-binding transcriptional regulator [Lachnospiraceae bacterium]